MAEKEGFEPSNTLWVLHDFQSCALGRTTRLLRVQNNIQMFSLCIIIHFSAKVKTFAVFEHKRTPPQSDSAAGFCALHGFCGFFVVVIVKQLG